MITTSLWVGFILLILALLAIDLGVLHRGEKAPTTKEALGWTVGWVVVSLLFTVAVKFIYEHHWFKGGGPGAGNPAVILYLTGYIIEKLLSLDNIFVMAALMSAFKIAADAQHRVLYWGILGALILRGLMIAAGTAVLTRFGWLMYPLGAALIYTGAKMFFVKGGEGDDEEEAPNPDNLLVRLARKVFPVAEQSDGHHFFVKENGRWAMTPVFMALVAIEASDVVFALDSVPAVLAVTLDPFIVFTSNVFAILGLRSLYFVLGSMLDKFALLKPALSLILVFVGIKLAGAHHFKLPPLVSLTVILGVLGLAVLASVLQKRREG